MIESSPVTVNISSVSTPNDDFDKLVRGLQETPYEEERGFGFSPEMLEPTFASGYLIMKNTVRIQDYDPQSDTIQERDETRTELIPFRVNEEQGLLEVFSNKSDTKKVKTRLADLVDWDLTIHNIGFNLPVVYQYLRDGNHEISITSLRISNFSVDQMAKGSAHLNVFGDSEADTLVSDYGDDITHICAEVETKTDEVTIGFYNTGSIRFYNSLRDDEKMLREIESAIADSGGIIYE